jgi:hypothetical protein
MKRLMILAALLASSATANAEIVTFDGVPFDEFSSTPMSTYVEGGVTVTSLGGSFWAFSGPGELHLDPDGFGTSAYDFTYAGGAFDLVGFEIVFAEDFGAIGAFLEGFDEEGNLLNSLFVTDFGAIPLTGFDGLYTFRITSFGDTFDHFSIDNVEISAPVPEPGTWLTMLLGFGVVGAALRRRRFTAKLRPRLS